MEEIENWFRLKDYKEGVKLYLKFGRNDFLKELFQESEDDYNRQKLESEFQLLLAANTVEPPIPRIIKTILSEELKPLSEASNAPNDIKDKVKRRKYLYASSREAFAKMKVLAKFGNENETGEQALLILNNFDEINELWNYTNFYNSTGRVPISPKESQTDFSRVGVVELNKKWLTNYKYIRIYVKDSSKLDNITKRISDNQKIKNILIKKDAFQHTGLEIPTP